MAPLSLPAVAAVLRAIPVAAIVAIVIALPANPGSARQPAKITDCFWQLEHGRDREIDCLFPTRLTEVEKGDLRRLTRERLQDATCVVSIRIDRALLTAAIVADDLEFVAPPQAVRCELVTPDSRIPINGTFAPRISIRGGQAVDATPGLDNVDGVPSYLSWPVVQYVNRSSGIRDNVLTFINAYRAHLAARG